MKTYSDFIGEGLASVVKLNYRMTKLNAFVFNKAAELMGKDPKKYQKVSDTINDIEKDVEKKYNEIVKGIGDAIPFHTWWKDFSRKIEKLA